MSILDDHTATRRSAWGLNTTHDDPEDWRNEAICNQTDFFPEKGGTTAPAKKICLDCPVRAECLQYALDHDERFGIWGGLSERERRRLKRGETVTPAIRGHKHPGAA